MRIELATNPYAVSESPLDSEDVDALQSVMVRGEWSPSMVKYMSERSVNGLYLNYARGWKGDDYSFLRHLPWLQLLDIIAMPCEDLSPVGNLLSLQRLSISCHTKCPVDFSRLVSLRSCFLSWWHGAESVFQCKGLESLYLDKIREQDLNGLSNLTSLRKLTIGNSTLSSLEPLAGLQKLEKLELLNCR